MILRGLVLWQPWAHACIYWGKEDENRGRPFSHRGPLVIVAAASTNLQYENDAYSFMTDFCEVDMSKGFNLDRGGIIGCVELYDVVGPGDWPASPWHIRGQYAHRIRKAVPLPFRPIKGHQGLMRIEMTDAEVKTIEAGGIACDSCSLCKEPVFTYQWAATRPDAEGYLACPHCQGV